MDAKPDLATCDWCKCLVGKKKIEKHKALNCSKAPAGIIAARPKLIANKSKPKRDFSERSQKMFRVKIEDGEITFDCQDPKPPTPDRLPTTPSSQDRQINPDVTVTRIEEGVFHVHRLLFLGGSWNHTLQVECEYCHRTIIVNAFGPSEMQKFATDEACRLALIEHLRKDDVHSLKHKKLKSKAPDVT